MSIGTERPIVFRGVSGPVISTRVLTIRCIIQHGGAATISEVAHATKLNYQALCADLHLMQNASLAEVYDHAGARRVRLHTPALVPLRGPEAELWARLWTQWTNANMQAPVSYHALAVLLGWQPRQVSHTLHDLARSGWVELRTVGRKTVLAVPSMGAIIATLRETSEWGQHQQQVEAVARAGALLEEAQHALAHGDPSRFLGVVVEAHSLLIDLTTRARAILPQEAALRERAA